MGGPQHVYWDQRMVQWELVLSSHCVVQGDQAQVVKLDN